MKILTTRCNDTLLLHDWRTCLCVAVEVLECSYCWGQAGALEMKARTGREQPFGALGFDQFWGANGLKRNQVCIQQGPGC